MSANTTVWGSTVCLAGRIARSSSGIQILVEIHILIRFFLLHCTYTDTLGTKIKSYEAHGWEVLDIAVFEDNSKFVSCGGDKTVFLWDVSTGQTIRRFMGHFSRVNTVDFNFDGSVIASGMAWSSSDYCMVG